MELPTNCWDRIVAKPAKPAEQITDARRAELEESERRLQDLKPSLSAESQPEPEPKIEFEQPEGDVEFRAMFLRCYGSGWKRGYYGNPDKAAICPFSDPEEREIWEQGVCDGFETYEMLEGIPLRALREKYLQRQLKKEDAA